jgi:peptidoglycan/xylan/chitin deacetylase (PgdA/CDA1 family)
MIQGAAMIKKRLMAVVFLSILLTYAISVPSIPGEAGQAAMDSITQKSVKLPIVMYHSIVDDPKKSDVYVTTPKALRSDLKYLKENGFEAVNVRDLINYVNGQGTLPEKPVMITFDDGHYNTLYHVLPILQDMDMKAVLSIVGSYADEFSKKHDPDPNYGYLSWDEIRILKESGYFEIQNHSYAMHTLNGRRGCQRKSGESQTAYCSTFNSDVMKQQMLLQEHCGAIATAFVYPYGLVCSEAQYCLLQMHFSASLTCVERVNYIQAGNPDCLFSLGRFNRSGKVSTKTFMNRILKQLN